MNFNFQFSNLLGTVYRRGNLIFSPDGNTLFSPVGNKISAFDLKAHKSETLNIEGRHDYTCMALSPNGVLLLAANEDGEVHLISLISKTILQNLRTNRTISALSFSPDGKQFAIAKENLVLVYRTPGAQNKDYNPFGLDRVLKGAFDDTITLTWSSCSRVVAVGSKDNTTRLYAVREKFSNFSSYCLGGHSDPIVSSFFEEDSLNCYTLSRNGHLVHWEASLEPEELVPLKKLEQKKKGGKKSNKKKGDDEEEEEEDDMPENLEEDNTEDKADAVTADNETSQASKLFYTRKFRHFLRDALPKEEQKKQDSADSEAAKKSNKRAVDVTAADFHANLKLLVTGFSNGVFLIHEMPDANMIHSLSISEQSIMSVTFNPSGDWIAFGCSKLGQLLVWEWQSETYVLKQQGHFNNMACVSFSPDGTNMATGGQDGKVKLWTSLTGFCYVTFTEHTASVTAVRYSIGKNNVVFSASLDGTVRAFDTTRYRNFRTFTSPRPAQFSSLSVDLSGDLVASGATDVYEVFLWSVQTGHLLEVISGHEGPVSSLAFNPSPANGSSQLATVSWDKTMKIWDALDANSSNTETIQIMADATALAFRPDGLQVAVATLNGQITFFHPVSGTQTGSIEGRGDLTVGRSDTDLITPKKAKAFFTALSYTADGQFILAGGQSKTICIYHVGQNLLVKKFEVTQNRSFDAMDDVISRKKMTEFGNLSLVEDRDDPRGKMAIKLPGTRKGDLSSRAHRPQVSVSGLEFSPTGREFAAATTEGLLMFSLDSKMIFDPFELEEEVTPKMTRGLVVSRDYGRALSMALRLNEPDLIREVMEQIPPDQVTISMFFSLKNMFCNKYFVG
jgi:periodic tryptophan protein 2